MRQSSALETPSPSAASHSVPEFFRFDERGRNLCQSTTFERGILEVLIEAGEQNPRRVFRQLKIYWRALVEGAV